MGTLVAGNVVDMYSTDSSYSWLSIWMVPFAMAVVFLVGFLFLFKEDVKNRNDLNGCIPEIN